MNNRKDIAAFAEGDVIQGFYALRDASLQNTSSGKPYIRMTVADASGAITGNIWEGAAAVFPSLVTGGVIKMDAWVESYRGSLQLKIGKVRMAAAEEVDPALFLPCSRFPLEDLEAELDGCIARVADPDYAALLHAFFDDPEFRRAFTRAPAAKSNHHAWVGGLMEHTVTMARYAVAMLKSATARLDASLLLTGVILHDAGKIHELTAGATVEYSDRGRLLGHISIGCQMLAERARSVPGFPDAKLWVLQHLILSHHGRYEYGSPVLPQVPEALVLHHLDNLDAKTVAATRLLEDDPTAGNWTARSHMLEVSLYRVPWTPVDGAPAAPAPAVTAPAPEPRPAATPAPATAEASPAAPSAAPRKPRAPRPAPADTTPDNSASAGESAPAAPGGLFQ